MNLLAELLISLMFVFSASLAVRFRVYSEPKDYDDLLSHTSLPEDKYVRQRILLHSSFDNGRISSAYGRFYPLQTLPSFEEYLQNVEKIHARNSADSINNVRSRQPTRNTLHGVSMKPSRYDHLSRSEFPMHFQIYREISEIPSKIQTSDHNTRRRGHEHLLQHPVFSPSEVDFDQLGLSRKPRIQDTLSNRSYLPSRISQHGEIGLDNIPDKRAVRALEGGFEAIKEETNRFRKTRRVATQAVKNATEYTKDIAVTARKGIRDGVTIFDRIVTAQRLPKATNRTSHIPYSGVNPLLNSSVAWVGSIFTQVAENVEFTQINEAVKKFLDALKWSADRTAEKLSSKNRYSNRNLLNVLSSVVKKLVPELVAKYDDPVVQQFMDFFLEELLFYSSAYCNAKPNGVTEVPQRDIMIYRRDIRNRINQMMNSWQ